MSKEEIQELKESKKEESSWQKNAVLMIMGSLMAYNFYGGIDATSINKSQEGEIVQLKSEQRDLWGKYNDDIKEKMEMIQSMGDYMIEQEKEKSRLQEEISRIELENNKKWEEFWKNKAKEK